MARFLEVEWDYFLQGFRLHQRLTKPANREAQRVLFRAIDIAMQDKRDIPRARGLLSFTQLTAFLNDWIDVAACDAMLAVAKQDIVNLGERTEMGEELLAPIVDVINSLDGKEPLAQIVSAVIAYYAATAVAIDPSDFDNHWSLGTALLYWGKFDEGLKSYQTAADLAEDAPEISRDSLKIDRADALFFCAPLPEEGCPVPEDVERAIQMAQQAIDDASAKAPDDSKRFRWNWTLGWAHYEANDFARSLTALLQIRNPHDLIKKNIIASYVGIGMGELAVPIARDILNSNPTYTLAIEHRWPYKDDARRERWKAHLREAGLPD